MIKLLLCTSNLILDVVIRWCKALHMGGMTFQPVARSQRNSHAIVQLPQGPHNTQFPAQILGLLIFTTTEDVFGVISRYASLNDTDAKCDPYPQFGAVAGQLYYDAVEPPFVVNASNFLTLFAMTPMQLDYISKPVVHVLPLYKVLHSSFS